MSNRLLGLVVALVIAVGPPAARAEPLIFVPSDDLANGMLNDMLARDLLKGKSAKRRNTPTDADTSTVVRIEGRPRMPKQMAAHLPPAQRAQAARTYQQVLDGYRQIERRLGVPRHDLAGAVAAFIAGSWMAYRDRDLPDAHFPPLVRQIRQIIGPDPAFQSAGPRERQETYEQMAILGTMMALTREGLKQQPDASTEARMREAAKGYLEQFLKTDADRVDITESGLVLR